MAEQPYYQLPFLFEGIEQLSENHPNLLEYPVFIKLVNEDTQEAYFAPVVGVSVDTLHDPNLFDKGTIFTIDADYSRIAGFGRLQTDENS